MHISTNILQYRMEILPTQRVFTIFKTYLHLLSKGLYDLTQLLQSLIEIQNDVKFFKVIHFDKI